MCLSDIYKIWTTCFSTILKNQTSVVFSFNNSSIKISDHKIKDIISKYNKFYKLKSFSIFEKFNLDLSLSKNYYYKNILGFSDNLHKIHPLAGQGFNMTLRDIKIFGDIIEKKLNLDYL